MRWFWRGQAPSRLWNGKCGIPDTRDTSSAVLTAERPARTTSHTWPAPTACEHTARGKRLSRELHHSKHPQHIFWKCPSGVFAEQNLNRRKGSEPARGGRRPGWAGEREAQLQRQGGSPAPASLQGGPRGLSWLVGAGGRPAELMRRGGVCRHPLGFAGFSSRSGSSLPASLHPHPSRSSRH